MKIWGAVAAYLAVQGLIVVAMLLMAFIGFAAVFTQWLMLSLGFSEEVASYGMTASTFIAIYLAFQMYSAVKYRKWYDNNAHNPDSIDGYARDAGGGAAHEERLRGWLLSPLIQFLLPKHFAQSF